MWKPPREECFGERRAERDYLGLVSFGFFLLIVGYIFSTNTWILSEFQAFFESLGEGVFVPPSSQLRYVFALFLGLIGVSDFVMAGAKTRYGLIEGSRGCPYRCTFLHSMETLEW